MPRGNRGELRCVCGEGARSPAHPTRTRRAKRGRKGGRGNGEVHGGERTRSVHISDSSLIPRLSLILPQSFHTLHTHTHCSSPFPSPLSPPPRPLPHLFHAVEDPPPPSDVVHGRMLSSVGAREQDHSVQLGKVAVLPWFHRTDEVDDLCIATKPGKNAETFFLKTASHWA